MRKNIVVFFLIFACISTAVAFFFLTPAVFSTLKQKNILFTVHRGVSLRTVAADLYQKKLVRSEYAAYLYFRLTGVFVRAGTYMLSQSMSVRDICRYLAEGKQEYLKVTIPEGMTLSKTAAMLEHAGVITADAFLDIAKKKSLLDEYNIQGDSVEGFLFPDTYFFTYNEVPESVMRVFLNTFFKKIESIPNMPKKKQALYNTVILASIIEREYRLPKEAAKIAGVFTNRLNIGMGLQSCATIEYIITEIERRPHPIRLFAKDLSINSAYNTYKWSGLPPSPIASPGITALYAACNPEKHDYYFFRLENAAKGNHIFTKTLSAHARMGLFITKKAAGQ